MINISYKKGLLIALLVVQLTSCRAQLSIPTQPHDAPTPQTNNANECIQNNANLAVPIGAYGISEPDRTFIPPSGWELVTSFPSTMRNYGSFFEFVGSTIWVSDHFGIAEFDINKGVWEAYEIPEFDESHQFSLLVSQNGEIWKIYYSPFQLEHYNSSLNGFENVTATDSFGSDTKTMLTNIAVEDNQGKFWFVLGNIDNYVDDVYLYSFNPQTLEITKHSIKVGYQSFIDLMTDSSGNIWMVDRNTKTLLEYNPDTGNILYLSELPRKSEDPPVSLEDPLSGILTIFQDRSGKLWLGNKGWLDFSDPDYPNLYQVILPPEFLTYRVAEPPTRVLTTFVHQILQSKNGWMWFASDAGVVRLEISHDYQHGEWCLITNWPGALVRENNGYLWMLVNKQIYKYQIPSP